MKVEAPPIYVSYSTSITQFSAAHYPGDTKSSTVWMDYGRSEQRITGRRRLHGQQSSPALYQIHTAERQPPVQYSNPLPQTQWTDVPNSQQPSKSTPSDRNQQPRARPRSVLPVFRPQPPPLQGIPPEQGRTKHRRRVHGLREFLSREKNETQPLPVDLNMLYPQMNPYGHSGRLSTSSTHSAPDELEHVRSRERSGSSASQYLPPPTSNDLPLPMGVPRSPTYPPGGRGRMHSSAGLGDAAFDDEAEFRLFVEATAGLGPEQSFRHSDPLSPVVASPRRTQSERTPLVHVQSPVRDMVSPLSDTPTTRLALQQLAQMPEASYHSQTPTDLLEVSPSNLVDSWLQARTATPDILDVSPLEEEDDELPDYAESQAQAQQHQRAEAARRAQELQRRWQLSGARRGI
jgi:hypothetical protein